MKKVAVVGVGITKYGKLMEWTTRELFSMAAMDAVNDAGISPREIEAIYYGNFVGEPVVHQAHMGPIMAENVGVPNVPAFRFESACASSGAAINAAYMAIAGGFHDVVLVGGAEKLLTLDTAGATDALGLAADDLYELSAGLTFPALYALIARAHMNKYGTTEEQLASIAVKNHANAAQNPVAQFRKEITMEKALGAMVVAAPLKLFDCCPFSDGAAALVMVSEDMVARFKDPVFVAGSGIGSDYIGLHDRVDMTRILAAEIAADQAYKQAGIGPGDVDVAEVHDCFTIAEVVATEGLGFFKKGEAASAAADGETKIGGRIPVNASGGLKAKGHPVGATGAGQVVEVVEQLRGECGTRQVDGAEIGLAHNVGGSGATATVHILRR